LRESEGFEGEYWHAQSLTSRKAQDGSRSESEMGEVQGREKTPIAIVCRLALPKNM
jgi:hypothetical protein